MSSEPQVEIKEKIVYWQKDIHAFEVFITVFLLLTFLFFIFMSLIEKYKPKVGHETGITILLGMGASYLFWLYYGNERQRGFQFSANVFFEFFLPPVIFNSGYNLRKKQFFYNLGNILIFGLLVTFTCFAIYSYITYWMINNLEIPMVNQYALKHDLPTESEANPTVIKVDTMKILLICALLCSSDVVAAVSIVDYFKQPKLFSCIFGEGIVNDAVSIILFNTVLQL
jgi:sodium/hydrogen exchanger-like protein 6/7/sodium/hydrogen exchanger 8